MGAKLAAIVTGAASGIGRHLATALAAQGHDLLLTDVNLEALEAQAAALGHAPPRIETRRLDVRDPAAWEAAVDHMVKRCGRLDLLLNIAGYLKPGRAHEASADEVDRHIDINAKGVIHGTRAAAAVMVRQRAGHIVNMGSLAALAPVPGLTLYSASKFAVRGYTLAAAEDLAPHGVAVTLVCPDAVRTPMLDLQVGHKEAALTFSGPRALTVEEIGAVILGDVLTRRPREVVFPRSRGLLAKLAGFAPGLASLLRPMLEKKGLAAQEAEKRKHAGERV